MVPGQSREEKRLARTRRLRPGREAANAAIQFSLSVAFIGAAYLGIVVGLGAALGTDIPHTGLSVLATTIVAVGFGRARRRSKRLADRLTYGERATPEEVLSRFSEVARSDAPDRVLPQAARLLSEGTGAARAEIWVRVEDGLYLAASHPEGPRRQRIRLSNGAIPAIPGADRVKAVRHQDELLGAIAIAKRAGDPVTAAEDQLLVDVASQAGLVLRTGRLTSELAARLEEVEVAAAELRASRQRIVETQDAERRRLERDIHDGAQQHLVALAVKLRMTKTAVSSDPARAQPMLGEARTLIEQALENLRDLARGIYPPVLAEHGIAPALRAQVGRAGIRTTVSTSTLPRFEPAVETAAYFCCLEAVQNAAKHGAGEARVRLERAGGELVFSISDDGAGFDQTAVVRGSGLQNMEDRIAAVGGRLEITSSPGVGTTVTGRVPVSAGDKPGVRTRAAEARAR